MQEMDMAKPTGTVVNGGSAANSAVNDVPVTVRVTAGKVPVGVVPLDVPVGTTRRKALELAAQKIGKMRNMDGPAFTFDVDNDLPEVNNKQENDWEAAVNDQDLIMFGTRIAGNR